MTVRVLIGDCRERLAELPAESVHCVVTSPPYFGLRDYGVAGQIGLEPTPDEFVAALIEVFREVRRVLRDDGTLWLNLGDTYYSQTKGSGGRNPDTSPKQAWKGKENGQGFDVRRIGTGGLPVKQKDLIGIPWRVAFALQADGWYLRSDIIWHKPNPMPESVTDRPTSAHEHVFLLAKSPTYFFDQEAVSEPALQPIGEPRLTAQHKRSALQDVASSTLGTNQGAAYRNIRNVWTIATQPFSEAHFATFPPALVEPCIKAGCPKGGTVLDPFGGAGTTGLVADRLGRDAILIELNPEYAAMARRRIERDAGMFGHVEIATFCGKTAPWRCENTGGTV